MAQASVLEFKTAGPRGPDGSFWYVAAATLILQGIPDGVLVYARDGRTDHVYCLPCASIPTIGE
jgi:hypothetical protein